MQHASLNEHPVRFCLRRSRMPKGAERIWSERTEDRRLASARRTAKYVNGTLEAVVV